jgi:hypothetical protein
MTNFRYWRKMTWALVLWSAGALVFIVVGGFGLSAIAISALGLIVLGFIWFMSRPPWRVGHGASWRSANAVDAPFRAPRSATQD